MHPGDPRSTGTPPDTPDGSTKPRHPDREEPAPSPHRWLFFVNTVPLAFGLVASSLLPGMAQAHLSRDFTVGLVWGFLQITLFVVTSWWFVISSARRSDTDAHAAPDPAVAQAMRSAGAHEGRRWDR